MKKGIESTFFLKGDILEYLKYLICIFQIDG